MTQVVGTDTLEFTGYSSAHNAYVLPEIAIQNGAICTLNEDGYFDLPNGMKVKPYTAVKIRTGREEDYKPEWIDDLWDGFGAKGIVALTFWFGSLFSEQIRQTDQSFPFLEISGEPGSGKTLLIDFLWTLFGRADYEGFAPERVTVLKRNRVIHEVSNLPVVLLKAEYPMKSDHEFDWDELKTAYNGRASLSSANKSERLEDKPFKGSLTVSNIDPILKSTALSQRSICVKLSKKDHTSVSHSATNKLLRYNASEVSYFLVNAIKNTESTLATLKEKTPEFEKFINNNCEVGNSRIAKNHSQILSLLEALMPIANLSKVQVTETIKEIVSMAITRNGG